MSLSDIKLELDRARSELVYAIHHNDNLELRLFDYENALEKYLLGKFYQSYLERKDGNAL